MQKSSFKNYNIPQTLTVDLLDSDDPLSGHSCIKLFSQARARLLFIKDENLVMFSLTKHIQKFLVIETYSENGTGSILDLRANHI